MVVLSTYLQLLYLFVDGNGISGFGFGFVVVGRLVLLAGKI